MTMSDEYKQAQAAYNKAFSGLVSSVADRKITGGIRSKAMTTEYRIHYTEFSTSNHRGEVSEFLRSMQLVGDIEEWDVLEDGSGLTFIVHDHMEKERRSKVIEVIENFDCVSLVSTPWIHVDMGPQAQGTYEGFTYLHNDELKKRVAKGYEEGYIRGQLDILDKWREEMDSVDCTRRSYLRSRNELLNELELDDDD